MQQIFKRVGLVIGVVSLLVQLGSCGGPGAGAAGDAPSTSANVAKITLSASATSMDTTPGSSVTITALVKNKDGLVLPGVNVSFSTDSGDLTVSSPTTGNDGKATAVLTSESDISTRSIQVTAKTDNNLSDNIIVVTNGAVLTVTRSSSGAVVPGATEILAFKLKDSAGANLAGKTIQILQSGTVIGSTTFTDANGSANYLYTVPTGLSSVLLTGRVTNSPGVVTTPGIALTITSQAQATISITGGTGQTLVDGTPITNVSSAGVNTVAGISVSALCNGAATASTVTLATTRGNLSTTASPSNLTSTSVGFATVNATVSFTTGVCNGATLNISKLAYFQATNPNRILLQASPDVINVNANLNAPNPNLANIVATVLDANNNPVRAQTLNFSTPTDNSGGVLLTAVGTTNEQGQVTIQYKPGATPVPSGGVVVRAILAANPAITKDVSLAVNGSSLFVNIGTGNQIAEPSTTTYSAPYVVFVTDGIGTPRQAASVTLRLVPLEFGKGTMQYVDGAWTPVYTVRPGPPIVSVSSLLCANEDLDFDGVADPGELCSNCSRLRPGIVPAIELVSGNTTNAQGQLNFNLIYPQNYAYWATYRIVATATVSGTEGQAVSIQTLPGLASDQTSQTTSPPGLLSPYGIEYTTCTTSN